MKENALCPSWSDVGGNKSLRSCSFKLCCDQERELRYVKHLAQCPYVIYCCLCKPEKKNHKKKTYCHGNGYNNKQKQIFFLSQTEPQAMLSNSS